MNTSYSYDNLSRLLSVLHTLNSTTVDGASYTVDAVGNRTVKTNQLNAVSENYGYDAIYQLLQVTQGVNTTENYSYDPVGNRLSSFTVPSYTYNNSNQLTSTTTATYTYDNNGNTLTKTEGSNVTTYAWDYENRLTSVILPGSGGTVSFKYDPFGRKIQKSSVSGTTNYAYDGADMAEEVDGAGSAIARYSMGPGIDQPFAMLRGGVTSYYQADGLGSVTSLTDASGSLATTYTYDSFGKLVASSGTLVNSFRYTGREFDPETGLDYYRARYYDPVTGRFIGEDSLRFTVGTDFYPYVFNNPVNRTDPLGLGPEEIIIWRIVMEGSILWGDLNYTRIQGHHRFPGESLSSMRHCTISCELALRWPTPVIRLAGNVNEWQGLVLHDIPDLWGRLTGRRPWAFSVADMRDNEKGFRCANRVRSGKYKSCEQCCSDTTCSNR